MEDQDQQTGKNVNENDIKRGQFYLDKRKLSIYNHSDHPVPQNRENQDNEKRYAERSKNQG